MGAFKGKTAGEEPPINKLAPLEILLLIILGGFAAVFLILTGQYNPTAALFPRWVAIASVLFLAAAVARQIFGAPKSRSREDDEEFVQPSPDAMPWPAVLGLQAGYILAIYLVGFTFATLLYLIAAPIQMRFRKWAIIAAQALGLTVVIAGSFIWFFHIRLPNGVLWNLW